MGRDFLGQCWWLGVAEGGLSSLSRARSVFPGAEEETRWDGHAGLSPRDWAQAEDIVLSVKHCRALLMFQELWEVSCPSDTAPQNIPGLGQHGEHQEAAPAELQQEGTDSSQPAHALYKTCCFCLVVFSKCSLLKPLSYCAGFHLKDMFRVVT